MTEAELKSAVEILPDRLYHVSLRTKPSEDTTKSAHFFTMDNELIYWNFFLDFGPLNLAQLYRFCQRLNTKLKSEALRDKVIYYYSGSHAHKRTNAAFLICAWSVLYLDRTPEEAFRPFRGAYPPFPPFHDASPCVCTYNLNILDCLRGLAKARYYKFFDFSKFNAEEYEYYEQVENGDLNWIIEGKFLAFAGPHNSRELSPEGYYTLTPEDYGHYFVKNSVSLVVRLNKKYYDEQKFKDLGIGHLELYYLDGSIPTNRILQTFLEACETTPGAVAVHCKAGLGRTGTCVGCYMMKHYRFTAAEAIGWIRICRPGSIIGPQQHYLKEMEQTLWHQGDVYRQAQLLAKREGPTMMMPPRRVVQQGVATRGAGGASRGETKEEETAGGSRVRGERIERMSQDLGSISLATGAGALGGMRRGEDSHNNSSTMGAGASAGGGASGANNANALGLKVSGREALTTTGLSTRGSSSSSSGATHTGGPTTAGYAVGSQGDSLLHRRALNDREAHRREGTGTRK